MAGFRIHMQSKKKKEEEGEESVSMLRNVWVCVCVVRACVCLHAGSCAHIYESDRVGVLLCCEISWNGLPSGVCESMKQNVTV